MSKAVLRAARDSQEDLEELDEWLSDPPVPSMTLTDKVVYRLIGCSIPFLHASKAAFSRSGSVCIFQNFLCNTLYAMEPNAANKIYIVFVGLSIQYLLRHDNVPNKDEILFLH